LPNPTKYAPQYSFSGFQAQSPDRPLPAMQLDNELQNIANAAGETIDALATIRRSDGQLVNEIVTVDSLSRAVRALIAGVSDPGSDGLFPISDVIGLQSALDTLNASLLATTASIGQPNGIARLDATGKLALTHRWAPTFAEIASKPTTLAGYGIADAYTKLQTNQQIDAAVAAGGGGSGGGSDTPSQVLEKIKTVDGSSSGLDADLLDGLEGAAYLKTADRGQPNGVATLGADSKIPSAQLPVKTVFSPYDFGGKGDGVTNDSAAVQACFDAVRTLCNDSRYRHPNVQIPMSIDLRGGDWKIVTSINATNIVAWNLEIQGGLLRGHCTGKAILDLVNSRGYTLRQIGFYGDYANMPSCAFQMARATEGGFCDNDAFVEVSTAGWFSRTAVHIYAHETAKHEHCTYFNNNSKARVVIWEGFSGNPFTSDYSPVMSGGTSFINNKVDTCDMRYLPTEGYDLFACTAVTIGANPTFTFNADHNFQVGEKVTFSFYDGLYAVNKEIGTVTARTARTITVSGVSTAGMTYSGSGGFVIRCATNPPVLLSRACDFNFDTSYIVAYGTPQLELAFPDAGFPKLLQIQLNILFEGSGNTCNVFFNTGNKACNIQGFKFRTYQAHPKFAIFGMSADANARLALYCDDLQSVEQFANVPIFNDPGKTSIAGVRAIIPSKALMDPAAFMGFNGTITQLSDGATSQHGIVGSSGGSIEQTAGTWSPALRGSNGTTVSGYSASGTWLKVGRMVLFTLNYTINNVGSASGVLQIANMPFSRDAPASFAGRDGSGQGTIGNGGTSNPNLLNVARYDNASSLVTGAGFMSGSFSTAT